MGTRRAKKGNTPSSVRQTREASFWWRMSVFIREMLFDGVWFLFAAVIGYFFYAQLKESDFFSFKPKVIQNELIFASPQSIEEIVLEKGAKNLWQIDSQALAAEINALSWVRSARVSIVWPDAVKIEIDERMPFLRWGEYEFLDETGYRFVLPLSEELQQLLIVHGPDGYEKAVMGFYEQVYPWLLARNLPVRKLILDKRLSWYLVLEGDITVILGREELNERLKKLVVVYDKVLKKQGRFVKSVDLRYQDGFSISWKDGVTPKSL